MDGKKFCNAKSTERAEGALRNRSCGEVSFNLDDVVAVVEQPAGCIGSA